ncbi:outer membrane efflux protein [Novosphingobium nitrogenifigens DSM 19370]|uniref:Outer membrane efflux protein n=1 Tax=Novosphingobium nitrogenifigens DSM 19370 TaxID=983920 RepID=F1ZAR9_9SPHN|nr:TolC family protein [Novosphingobium nitrogenifigens]EGD58294.1 outer membrane efflux protein [Novosphingobium nitrogenifigens DSM 19370]
MRKAFSSALALTLALATGSALAAQDMPEAGLPSKADVLAALDAHPTVEAANARTDAARADARALSRGPHEFIVTGGYASRTVNDGTGVANGRFDEFEAQVTRPIRLPGKATLDRRIGAQGVTYAQNMAEDARHQTALLLAQSWWDWLGAASEATVDRQAVENYRAVLASVKRRAALRDASALEEDQANAALGTAQAQAERSSGRETVARARLFAQFPGFPLPAAAPDVPAPHIPDGGLAPMRQRILGRSHELAAAEALVGRADAQAARARKERTGDPSFGFRLFSEKGGMEKGGGVLFSMPFGGGYRSALADKAGAEASAAQADLQAVRRNIAETADADLADAQTSYSAWQQARGALDAQVAALQKTRRGQQLGEIGLSDVLLAERMVHEAFRTEATARTDAMRALTKIRIDSHELWIGDDDDKEPAKPAEDQPPAN